MINIKKYGFLVFSFFVICGFSQSSPSKIIKIKVKDSWYWLGIPSQKNKKMPMIVALHGDEGHPNHMKKFWESTWKKKQDFVFLAPECPRGICNKGGVNTWAAGEYTHSDRQGIWLKNTISRLLSKYDCIDSDRIFAVGYSGGAIFLGYQGFKMFQNTFAGMQLFCGGINESEAQIYKAPKNPKCKIPGRVVISKKGDVSYLITAAEQIIKILKKNGHKYDYLDTGCKGHCCDAPKYTENALEWFLKLPQKCAN